MGVPVITITSDGQPLDASVEVLSLEVQREVNRVPEATVILLDGSLAERRFAISNLSFFLPGASIRIALRLEGDPSDSIVFEGLVVRHAVERSGESSTLRVELKDGGFLLTRGRRSAVFTDATDSDVITTLIEEAGLRAGTIEATSTVQAELVRYNATAWDFLMARADALGLVVTAHRGEISLRRPLLGEPRRRLDHGLDDVSELSLELDGAHQWASVRSVGWDLSNGQATEPEEASDPGLAVGNVDIAAVAERLGGAEEVLLHPAALAPGELRDWASARLLRTRLALLRGRALVSGDARLEPLDTVEILGVGDRFNGRALVTGVVHTVNENGWQSELRFGLPPDPFASRPDLAALPAGGLLPPLRGLQIATIGASQEDDSNQFRVRVRLPALEGAETDLWARLASPDAGEGRGFVFRPAAGDEVVLGFLDEDPRQPVVLGALHSARHPPPKPVDDPQASADLRAIVSRAGTRIVFDDAKPSLTLETTPDGSADGSYKNRIAIDENARTITIEDQHGHVIRLSQEGIALTSAKDLTIEAKGKVTVKGASVDIQ
ncbi:MAG: phage baseplate assembly protein V [Cyanobacteriota bacterium]|nr:phage baseplate assembly protein V [Cyanobacteriota bacterium]